MKTPIIYLLLCIVLCGNPATAKKIKNSFKIEKDTKLKTNKSLPVNGFEIFLGDPEKEFHSNQDSIILILRKISFAGYEKEANSSRESFILVNPTGTTITGYQVRIDYLDMKDRMLHSRTIKEPCLVPPGESRKMDIKSWDTQHSYYYYLGNEPKKVATSYKVSFTPVSYHIAATDE